MRQVVPRTVFGAREDRSTGLVSHENSAFWPVAGDFASPPITIHGFLYIYMYVQEFSLIWTLVWLGFRENHKKALFCLAKPIFKPLF